MRLMAAWLVALFLLAVGQAQPALAEEEGLRFGPVSKIERVGGGGIGSTDDMMFEYTNMQEVEQVFGADLYNALTQIGVSYVPQRRMFLSRDFVFIPQFILIHLNGSIDLVATKEDLSDGQAGRFMASMDEIVLLRVKGADGAPFSPTMVATGIHRCPFYNTGLTFKSGTVNTITFSSTCTGMNRGEMFGSEQEVTFGASGLLSVVDADVAAAEAASPWKQKLDGVFARSIENPAVLLAITCDIMDGETPFAMIGVLDDRDPPLARQLMSGRENLSFRVTTTGKAGTSTFSTGTPSGYGGELLTLDDGQAGAEMVGGYIAKANITQLIRASSISAEIKGQRFTFPARGSAAAIGALPCSK